jgi:hypothetical protein
VQQLARMEADWLAMLEATALHDVCDTHWDADAGNSPLSASVVNHGEIYQREVGAVCTPQPFGGTQEAMRYLQATLEQDPHSKSAILLRAITANQKSQWSGVAYKLLVGEADRSNDGNARDKSYDIIKGLLTETGLVKHRWLTASSMVFAADPLYAVIAAVGILGRDKASAALANRYAPRLIRLQYLQMVYATAVQMSHKASVVRATQGLAKATATASTVAKSAAMAVGKASPVLAQLFDLVPRPRLRVVEMTASKAWALQGVRQITTLPNIEIW